MLLMNIMYVKVSMRKIWRYHRGNQKISRGNQKP